MGKPFVDVYETLDGKTMVVIDIVCTYKFRDFDHKEKAIAMADRLSQILMEYEDMEIE